MARVSLAVILMREGQAYVETTLDQFFADNEFSPDERAEIAADLDAGGLYHGGGGAAPMFTVATPDAYAKLNDPA